MTIAESRRLALYESVKTFLGEENAQTLMASLPPDPDTFATKADLGLLRSELRGEMAELRSDMKVLGADLSAQIARETRSLALAMIGMVLTVLTIALGAVALS
jgi:hypothetical protein